MQAEADEVYSLDHTRFARVPSTRLVSAEVSLDIMIGRDFDFNEDLLTALLVNSAWPNCPGSVEDCVEIIGTAPDSLWDRPQLNARRAVTRSDWSGFFLMLLISENHFSDSSMGVIDNIAFRICTRGPTLIRQDPIPYHQSDLRQLLDSLP